MSKSLSRILYLIGLVVVIVGVILETVGLAGAIQAAQAAQAAGTAVTGAGGNPTLVLVGGGLALIGGIVAAVGWIGALVKTAQLGRWGWFVFLIVFSGITMLIYIFAGPTTRPVEKVAQVS